MVPLNQEYGQGEKNKIKESSISLSLSLSLHTHIYNASKINMKRSRPLPFCCFYGQLCHMNKVIRFDILEFSYVLSSNE